MKLEELKGIRTIVFDYDGTIYNSASNYSDAFRHMYARMVADGQAEERIFKDEEITKWLGYSSKAMWEAFMPSLSKEDKTKYSLMIGDFVWERVHNKQAETYEGALETLKYLKNKGYNTIFLSNCGQRYMDVHTECFELNECFTQMYCVGNYDSQPKYKVFEIIKEQYPGEYLIVGDRFHDLEIARYHKAYTAGCLYGFAEPGELDGADIALSDIRELKKL